MSSISTGARSRRATRRRSCCIHGASGNLEDMRLALGERLSARYRVILVDRPGPWLERATAEPDAASPAHQAAMLSEMLDRLGIDRAIIVAHSWAGTVATALALDHPDQVAGLVLLAPVSHPWPGGIAWYYHIAAAPLFGPLFAYTLALPLGELLLRADCRGGVRAAIGAHGLCRAHRRRTGAAAAAISSPMRATSPASGPS